VLALAAAIVAVLYLILDWIGVSSDLFNAHTGLLIIAALLGFHFWFADGRATRWYGRSRG
jgi:ribose/xylose/arabinose/galactoside ABC-type transport system permease subunit